MKRTDGTAVNVDIHGVAVTDCRDRISEAKNHAAAGPRSWPVACAFACTRAGSRVRPAYPSEMSQHNDSFHRGPTHVLHDANASVGPCLSPTSDPLVRADVLLGQNLRARSASKLSFLQTSGPRLHACSTTDKLSSSSSRRGRASLASE